MDTNFPGVDRLTASFGQEANDLIADFRDNRDWKKPQPEFLNQAPLG
ncbi:MAG: hypothetical protein ACU84Q_13375 [Gammaproteobacteria bacterium]